MHSINKFPYFFPGKHFESQENMYFLPFEMTHLEDCAEIYAIHRPTVLS